jgi:hypothetical protein
MPVCFLQEYGTREGRKEGLGEPMPMIVTEEDDVDDHTIARLATLN